MGCHRQQSRYEASANDSVHKVDTPDQLLAAKDEFMEKLKGVTEVNIMVMGRSGVGKSSLINTLCNNYVAEVGQGTGPTTMKCTTYRIA